MPILVIIFFKLLSSNFYFCFIFFNNFFDCFKDAFFIDDNFSFILFINLFWLWYLFFCILIFLNFFCHLFGKLIVWNKWFNLYFWSFFTNLDFSFFFSEIFWMLHIKYFTQENCIWRDESRVKLIAGIDLFNWCWWSFRKFPERFSIFSFCL